MSIKDKVIIFDFDGVFVDDFDFHKKHIEKFLNITFNNQEFYDIHSGNVYESDALGLASGNFDAIKYFRGIREEFIKLPIVDGMEDVMKNVQKIGQSFIVSSSSESNIREFFAGKNICKNLCTIYGVETHSSKEKKFEKILNETGVSLDDVIFVTDTLGDILEANTMAIVSIAVTWGFQRIETLEQGAPFGFAHDASDIITLMEEYFSIQ